MHELWMCWHGDVESELVKDICITRVIREYLTLEDIGKRWAGCSMGCVWIVRNPSSQVARAFGHECVCRVCYSKELG
jgi:hypothetical protein